VDCRDAQPLLHAYLDRELDLMRSLEIEEHLRNCAACGQIHANHQALRATLGSELCHFAPAGLHGRIRQALRPAAPSRKPATRWLAAAASVALVVGLAYWLVSGLLASHESDRLAELAISSHIRSLMEGNLLGKPSSDRHEVKPWFNGKLDFAPPVHDLGDAGFPLLGGRLDYLDNRPVAALVYQRQKHVINLFVWPTSEADSDARAVERQGYNAIHWNRGGLTFWSVSDLNAQELLVFVTAFRGRR
jgi:anti-sigma factor RsiW